MIEDKKNRWCNRHKGVRILRISVLVAIMAILLAACGEQRFEAREAQDFHLSSLAAGGEIISLYTYRGDVVYLAFWASWCVMRVAPLASCMVYQVILHTMWLIAGEKFVIQAWASVLKMSLRLRRKSRHSWRSQAMQQINGAQ
jgi:hypothetical protein